MKCKHAIDKVGINFLFLDSRGIQNLTKKSLFLFLGVQNYLKLKMKQILDGTQERLMFLQNGKIN